MELYNDVKKEKWKEKSKKIKRTSFLVLCIILIQLLCPVIGNIKIISESYGANKIIDEEIGIEYEYIGDTEIKIIQYLYYRDIKIPSLIMNGDRAITVTKIGDEAFEGAKNMTITLPNTIYSMGENVFKNCSNIFVECNADSYVYEYLEENYKNNSQVNYTGKTSQSTTEPVYEGFRYTLNFSNSTATIKGLEDNNLEKNIQIPKTIRIYRQNNERILFLYSKRN